MKRCVQNATRSVLYLAQPQLFTSTIDTDTFNSQGIVAKINGRSPAKHFTKVLLQSNMNYMPAIIITTTTGFASTKHGVNNCLWNGAGFYPV